MKVVVTRAIPGPAIDLLQSKGWDVVVNPEDRVLTASELEKLVVGADAILSLLTDKIDSKILDAAGQQLKIVANYAVGYDNVDLAAAKERNVTVTNTPGGFESSVAEHTIGILLALIRKIVPADQFVRAGKYVQWEPQIFMGTELTGKTFGIIGMGRIGSVVARIAGLGLGMKVIYHSHRQCEVLPEGMQAEFVDNLEMLLANSDVVSLHTPLTSETEHMISKKELSSMKKTAVLVNTSRGKIVDEAALIEALKKGWIAGAALDVFEDESKTDPELYKLPNVVLTPHIASATVEARSEMSRMAAQNIIDALSGQTPKNVVGLS